MFKLEYIFTIAAATFVLDAAAQIATAPPTLDQMKGDFIIMNNGLVEYEDGTSSTYLKEVKPFTITPQDDGTLLLSGFYINAGKDIVAKYSPANGTISIEAGTKVFDWGEGEGGTEQYLYGWLEDDLMVSTRPVMYRYKGNNVWENTLPTVLMTGTDPSNLEPTLFSNGSKIVLSNAVTKNITYQGNPDVEQNRYEESRPSYVEFDGRYLNVYNLFQTTIPGYGYGCWLNLQYNMDRDPSLALSWPTTVGQLASIEYTHKVLAGCSYDFDRNVPTGPSYAGSDIEGVIRGDVDVVAGTITFYPMAMVPAAPSKQDPTQLLIDWNSFFEVERQTVVTFNPEILTASVDEITADEAQKQVVTEEYYTVTGQRVNNPVEGSLVIKLTRFDDGSVKSEKVIRR